MRLIGEDDVIALLANHHFDNDKGNFDLLIHNLCKEVRRIPTAYDVDAVVGQLEEEEEYSHADFESYAEEHGIDSNDDWHYAGLKRAIEIVEGGGVDAKTDS